AIAGAVDADGWLELFSLEGASFARIWHHEHLDQHVAPGEPVALHEAYHVLAVGDAWLNVRLG
ncbi:MAG: hypothetical protein QM607_02995, partial [Microbacterium sp.]